MPDNAPAAPRWSRFREYRARRDTASERIVETSFDLQRYCGTAFAARYLDAHEIDLELALRVLLHPGRRRNIVM